VDGILWVRMTGGFSLRCVPAIVVEGAGDDI
jgi:hypothetical protein